MPPYLTRYLGKYGKALSLLQHRDLRDEFLRAVLKGLDPKAIVLNYLRASIENSFHALGAFHAVRERKRILESRMGGKEMANYDKLISYIYYRGVDLRKVMVSGREGSNADGSYRASGRKKIEGIAYRLINATKAGDKVAFMDTVFRVYMSAGQEIPSVFVEGFKEDGLDFETIASSFIAGLLGQEETAKKEGVK
ncbi:MAG: hypothetical protein LRY73_14700 [Bacillus sp. (in: Bacteria)]|nr:hypothetical protein [Bacillus sp. (in: firmicutes)]